MPKKNQTNVAEINTLEAEGLELAKIWRGITKGDFKNATKANGFDTRLGKLMFALKAEGGQRISSQRLRDCGIAGIAKQRRAEALWFIENESDARAFMKTSKKGFTSLSALQKAMAKQSKTEDKPSAEPKGSDADAESDVGPNESETQEQSPVTASDIALEALVQCDANGIAIEDFMLALKEQLILVEEKVAA